MTDHMDPSKYFVVSIREYDEMKAEIERLRAMCDMLANRLRSGSDSGWDDAIDAWETAREFGNDPESQGSAKLPPNSETNIDDSIPSDSVRDIAQRLDELSRAYWLSDEDCRALEQAARLLLNLQRSIGIKDGILKSWDFMLNEAREQAQQAHSILGSEAMCWLAGGNSEHEQHHWGHLMPYIKNYWAKYGNIMRPTQNK